MKNKAGKDQFVLVNQISNHAADSLARIFLFSGEENLTAQIQSNWQYPVNFYQGKVHIHVNVLSKPAQSPIRYMLYLLSGGHGDQYRAVIGHDLVEFPEPGVYEFEQDVTSIFDDKNINWEKSLDEMIVSVWDRQNFPLDTQWHHKGKWKGSPNISLYYPMKVHDIAVVVAKGTQFKGFPGKIDWVKLSIERSLQKQFFTIRDRVRNFLRVSRKK